MRYGTARNDQRDAGLLLAIKKAGSITELAAELDISISAVSQWDKVPVRHCEMISVLYAISPRRLRPDVYDHGLKRKLIRDEWSFS